MIQLTDGYYTAFNDVVTHHHPLPSTPDIDSRVHSLQHMTDIDTNDMLLLDDAETHYSRRRNSRHNPLPRRNQIKHRTSPLSTTYLALLCPNLRIKTIPHTYPVLPPIPKESPSSRYPSPCIPQHPHYPPCPCFLCVLARKKVQTLRTSIQLRKESMHKGLQSQAQSQNHLLDARATLEERKSTQNEITVSIAAQRRRICLDLQKIYPIESIDDETLRFTIRGISLPAAGKYEGLKEEELSTALGWTAHLVYLISGYLGVPLRYPVQPVGGRSLIRDPVSVMMGARTYTSPDLSF